MYIYSENAQYGMAPTYQVQALHKVRILATDEQREPFDIYFAYGCNTLKL